MKTTEIALAAALALGAALVALAAYRGLKDSAAPSRCAEGLVPLGARCCGEGQRLEAGRCAGAPAACAAGMKVTPGGCVPSDPAARIVLPGGHLRIGPGDWEAQGVVAPHEADVPALAMNVYEVTEARWAACAAESACRKLPFTGEPGRPVTGMTYDEAAAFCEHDGGRLPTRDELAFAMTGAAGRRYAWGDTGAVCRRGAWGLANGPCASGGDGPDLAGAHPDGRSREGLLDLAGNVAEWVASPGAPEGRAVVLGGSWADAEAAALRSWNLRAAPKGTREPTIGFRCAYAVTDRGAPPP